MTWIKWPTAKRHWIDGAIALNGQTACGYQYGPDATIAVDPLIWRERDNWPAGSRWFRDNPRFYCGICKRIRNVVG